MSLFKNKSHNCLPASSSALYEPLYSQPNYYSHYKVHIHIFFMSTLVKLNMHK